MSEKQFAVENGIIHYKIEKDHVIITGFGGYAADLLLPPEIEGCPVTAIDRKAFLSRKSLCRVSLPDCLEEVGDWAFAHCVSLEEVSFPNREVRLGRAIFKDCGNLERIAVRERNCCPELLAASVTMLDAPYLLHLSGAGSSEWTEQWDIRLRSVLQARDSEGYISQSVYGEEDYIGMDLEEFMAAKRRVKVRLCFLRLLHPRYLSASLRELLEQYLRSLTKGQASEETWQIMKQEKSSHRIYYELFARLGCITEDNFQEILEDMGEDSPEMKAYFLKYMGERQGKTGDFFDSLDLSIP